MTAPTATRHYPLPMSTKVVIFWLLLAILLGIVAIFLLRGPSLVPSGNTIAVGDRLLTFSPGDVERITISSSGEPRQIIEKAPGAKSILGADAEWQLRIQPAKPGDFEPAPWPLESSKLQSLLRALGEMRAIALPASDASLGRPTDVQIDFVGKQPIKLSIAERTIAGTGLVEIDAPPAPPRRAVVDDRLHDVFTQPGPRAWREHFPVAGIAADASRIRMTSNKHALALARQEGKWFLREPVAAPADGAAVQRLLAQIQRITIADFLDSGASASSTGMENPTGTITIEADRRTVEPGAAEPKLSTDTLTLTIGAAADAGASKLFANVNEDRIVLLDARSLVISTDAASYLWAHPLRQPAADIGSVAISLTNPLPTSSAAKTIRRSGTHWSQVLADKTEVNLSDKDQRDADALVATLTGGDRSAFAGSTPAPNATSPARPNITLEKPKDYRPLGTIEVSSISGQPLDTIELGAAEKDQVVLRSGPVYRIYMPQQLPALLQAAWAASSPAASAP